VIISLRGTNGAGKSTIVRQVMKQYQNSESVMEVGRKKPIGYLLSHDDLERPLFVPGHYEIANGGVDTLPDLDYAYALIGNYAGLCDVLFEGKNMTDGADRISMFPHDDVKIIVVDHPITLCLDSVRQRGHSIKRETIVKTAGKVLRDSKVLQDKGYDVSILSRHDALQRCLKLLIGRREWFGVDFDHTLRRDDDSPISPMVERVREWLNSGHEVRIISARVSPIDHDQHDIERNRLMIEKWCEKHVGQRLPIQWGKSSGMKELWDDKAVHVTADLGYCPVYEGGAP